MRRRKSRSKEWPAIGTSEEPRNCFGYDERMGEREIEGGATARRIEVEREK